MPAYGKGGLWVERKLLTTLRRLQQEPEAGERSSWQNQCRTAFLSIPWNIRKLYAFAYLDRLWNICASERAALGGRPIRPIAGDLVWDDKNAKTVKVLSAEEAASASVFDVVLPRPGRDVDFPANSIGSLMRQYIRLDLDWDMEDLSIEVCASDEADWPLAGDYRSLLCKPTCLRWAVEPEEDVPRGEQETVAAARRLHCVTLAFNLPRGSYATMFFREICFRRGIRCSTPGSCSREKRHIRWDSDDDV